MRSIACSLVSVLLPRLVDTLRGDFSGSLEHRAAPSEHRRPRTAHTDERRGVQDQPSRSTGVVVGHVGEITNKSKYSISL